MKKLILAHLYYDIANLYGESGNVKVLRHYLNSQGVEVELVKKSLGEDFDFSVYDIVYIGAMTENNQKIILSDLTRYSMEIKSFIEADKFILTTGNALELFGSKIQNGSETLDGLSIFDFSTKYLAKRHMQEVILANDELSEIVGFQNQISYLVNVNNPWFTKVLQGMGASKDSSYEGIKYKNFYGSYVIGPLLARNPHLLVYLVQKILSKNGYECQWRDLTSNLDFSAYQSYRNIIKKVD